MARRKFSLMEEVQKISSDEIVSIENSGSVNLRQSKEVKEEIRATFIVDAGIVRKLKLIAALEKKKHKDVIGDALMEFVGKWETEHPTVNLSQIDIAANK